MNDAPMLLRAADRPRAVVPVRRRALCSGFAVLLLAGCGALPSKPARPVLYDFGPGAMVSQPLTQGALPPLVLSDVGANSRLEGVQILYRFSYADANELRPYGLSLWSQPPAQLLRERLRQGLSAGHMVIGPEDSAAVTRSAGHAPDQLRVTLEEFSQVFQSPDQSVGLVRLSATLTRSNPGGERMVAQRSFAAQRPAPTSDAPGGVKALAAASDAVVAEIVTWVDQVH
ncbi:MAG TPA: ABC-type transport auxiliary lipoprotein family protein [Variovorax sp.]